MQSSALSQIWQTSMLCCVLHVQIFNHWKPEVTPDFGATDIVTKDHTSF